MEYRRGRISQEYRRRDPRQGRPRTTHPRPDHQIRDTPPDRVRTRALVGVDVGVPERRLDASADQPAAAEALGVDPEQDLDRVPGPLGTVAGRTPPLSQVGFDAFDVHLAPALRGERQVVLDEADRLLGSQGGVVQAAEERDHPPAAALFADGLEKGAGLDRVGDPPPTRSARRGKVARNDPSPIPWRPGAPGRPAGNVGRPRRTPDSAHACGHAARIRPRSSCSWSRRPPAATW
jgi:hypothetical protein